jgi:hypothetical protein
MGRMGTSPPTAANFEMMWLPFRTLLPQVGGLMLARR